MVEEGRGREEDICRVSPDHSSPPFKKLLRYLRETPREFKMPLLSVLGNLLESLPALRCWDSVEGQPSSYERKEPTFAIFVTWAPLQNCVLKCIK